MKMYEKLGIDPTTEEGIKKIFDIHCYDMGDDIAVKCNQEIGCIMTGMSCSLCKARRLVAVVPTKKIKRWEKYHGDFKKALTNFRAENLCLSCKERCKTVTYCFTDWLMEEIEVEDNENV